MEKMDFRKISKIDDDLARNNALYNFLNEDARLKSRVGNVEYLTTLNAIENLLKPDIEIIDIGAGTGVYSLALGKEGYSVLALEPADKNFSILKNKIKEEGLRTVRAENLSSLDLERFPDNSFDLVLIFGPLYHLSSREDQIFTLEEAKRICRKDGHILVSFINHDMVPITETISNNVDWFSEGAYNKKTLRLENRPFIFFSLDQARDILEEVGLKIQKTIASDGFAELLGSRLDEMTEESYRAYLNWHRASCEKEELLGASNHLLFLTLNSK